VALAIGLKRSVYLADAMLVRRFPVNNVGFVASATRVVETSKEEWQPSLATNLSGPFARADLRRKAPRA
jgi:NAD(P)-dependent dehydrogenase (short-subunit alcohol dehydrogenase family)